uniref:Uncharacterized protein n=1 Tax=Oryza punctata TaxID=4537 RepID=A0A0E0MEJ9_ORYPU
MDIIGPLLDHQAATFLKEMAVMK